MMGIYKMTNILTGQVYIGQSKDIEQRFKEHRYHKKSNIGKAIWEYGKEIYQSVKDRCSLNTLQCILWGRSYKHLPIYNKTDKKWII